MIFGGYSGGMKLRVRIERLYRRHDRFLGLAVSIAGVLVSLLSGLIVKVSSGGLKIVVFFILPTLFLILAYRFFVSGIRAEYRRTVSSRQFYAWQLQAMRQLYGENNLTKVFGRYYSVTTIPFNAIKSELSAGALSSYSKGDVKRKLTGAGRVKVLFPGPGNMMTRLEYRAIAEHTIQFDIPGYMLDRYGLEDGKVFCHPGMYRDNVYTSNILEYELYKAFKRARKSALNTLVPVPGNLLDQLPMRKAIHTSCKNDIRRILKTGAGRSSLLSVQLMIVYFSVRENKYKTVVKKRSVKRLSIKQGYYQFVPAGGFDMCETEKDLYNFRSIKNGCDLKTVVWREFLEELFDQRNFQGIYDDRANTDPRNKIYSSPQYKLVERLIKEARAEFRALGAVVDLIYLRHNISFALYVGADNGEFEREIINNISFNWEFSRSGDEMDYTMAVDELQERFGGPMGPVLTSDSAGLYYLYSNSAIAPVIAMEEPRAISCRACLFRDRL